MHIVCLTHVPFEGPGVIEEWAAARAHSFEVLPVYDPNAAHPGEFDMLVVMGGPMSVDDEDEYPWLLAEKRLIRVAVDSGKIVLGICLGAQLLASALGSKVRTGAGLEIGWYPVRLTEAGLTDPILGALPAEFDALHWHGDTFDVPEGASPLASSALTENQAFSAADGRAVGLQFHLEPTRRDLETLIENAGSDLARTGDRVSTAEQMLAGNERFGRARERMFSLLDSLAAIRAGGARPTR